MDVFVEHYKHGLYKTQNKILDWPVFISLYVANPSYNKNNDVFGALLGNMNVFIVNYRNEQQKRRCSYFSL